MSLSDLAMPVIEADELAQPVAICASCTHPLAVHDAISQRYCAATAQMAMTRGCICRGGMADAAEASKSSH
ncbi:RGCVC family protein [Jatrophihabitans sp. DSM 45814]